MERSLRQGDVVSLLAFFVISALESFPMLCPHVQSSSSSYSCSIAFRDIGVCYRAWWWFLESVWFVEEIQLIGLFDK